MFPMVASITYPTCIGQGEIGMLLAVPLLGSECKPTSVGSPWTFSGAWLKKYRKFPGHKTTCPSKNGTLNSSTCLYNPLLLYNIYILYRYIIYIYIILIYSITRNQPEHLKERDEGAKILGGSLQSDLIAKFPHALVECGFAYTAPVGSLLLKGVYLYLPRINLSFICK